MEKAKQSFRVGAKSGRVPVLWFDLATERTFEATQAIGGTPAYNEYILTGAEFESLGPYIQELMIHTEGRDFSANFSYDLILQYRYDNAWVSQSLLTAFVTTTTYTITQYTTRTKFGKNMRLVLRTQINSGSTIQQGILSLGIAARLLT
jgi:hypothetical protein